MILENACSLTIALTARRMEQWSRQQLTLVGPVSNGTWGEEYVSHRWVREITGMILEVFYLPFSRVRRSNFMLGMPQTCAAYQLAVKTNKIKLLLRRGPSHHGDETLREYGKGARSRGPEARFATRRILGYRPKSYMIYLWANISKITVKILQHVVQNDLRVFHCWSVYGVTCGHCFILIRSICSQPVTVD